MRKTASSTQHVDSKQMVLSIQQIAIKMQRTLSWFNAPILSIHCLHAYTLAGSMSYLHPLRQYVSAIVDLIVLIV